MKVLAFNGSPRKDGNTFILINYLFKELGRKGIETELVQLSDEAIHGCRACDKCYKLRNKHCAFNNDVANEYIDKMLAADGLILGSPVYFNDVTPEMKALIDRTGYVSRANDRMFKDKVGASVAAVRRSGGCHTLDTMDHFFLSSKIIIVGRVMGFGLDKGDVEKDDEGRDIARSLGERMAWLLCKIHQ